MADPLTIAAVGMQVAGPIVEGIGANKEARAQARQLEQNASDTATQGGEDALFSLRQARLQAGADLAGSAAGGVGAGNGTLADLMRANAEARWQQAFNIQETSSKEANGLRAEARASRKRGKQALIGGIIRAGSAALNGYGDAKNADALGKAGGRRREQERKGPVPMGGLPLPNWGRG